VGDFNYIAMVIFGVRNTAARRIGSAAVFIAENRPARTSFF
jgi:hypothetical protein